MGQTRISLNGRSYLLRCGDGEEARLQELAVHVSERIDTLSAEFGQVGDERLLLMATLLITDELLDTRARLKAVEEELEAELFGRGAEAPAQKPPATNPQRASGPPEPIAGERFATEPEPSPVTAPERSPAPAQAPEASPPPSPDKPAAETRKETRAGKRPIVKSAMEERIAAAKAQASDRKAV